MKTFADYGIDTQEKMGDEIKVPCPRCSPSRKKSQYPCLNVSLSKSAWHCWHCGRSGSLLAGWNDERDTSYDSPRQRERQWRKPDYDPHATLLQRTIQWFARRGIPEAVLLRRKISVGTIYMPQVEEEVQVMQFPYFRDGECVNIKYRDAQKNFRMVAGAERLLYGLDDI